jgi:hypothetical protein
MLNDYGYNQTKPSQTKTKLALVIILQPWFGFGSGIK